MRYTMIRALALLFMVLLVGGQVVGATPAPRLGRKKENPGDPPVPMPVVAETVPDAEQYVQDSGLVEVFSRDCARTLTGLVQDLQGLEDQWPPDYPPGFAEVACILGQEVSQEVEQLDSDVADGFLDEILENIELFGETVTPDVREEVAAEFRKRLLIVYPAFLNDETRLEQEIDTLASRVDTTGRSDCAEVVRRSKSSIQGLLHSLRMDDDASATPTGAAAMFLRSLRHPEP